MTASNPVVRRGRPPLVSHEGNTFKVQVKGTVFAFRMGADGRLRGLGTRERNEDFAYARQQVEKVAGA